MNGSLIDLTARKGLGWLATLVQDLRTAAGREQVLLVGAQARDLLLHHIHGVRIVRATTDVDLAFAVADWDDVAWKANVNSRLNVIDYVESVLATETDLNGPLRLVGEVGAGEPDRKHQLLKAFLARQRDAVCRLIGHA